MADARPDPNWSPTGTQPRNRFFENLGVYILGVAIGLLFLGWVQWQKSQSIKRRQATEQTQPHAENRPAPATDSPAP